MATDTTTDDDPLIIIDCESEPIPPGTKCERLPRFDDPPPTNAAKLGWIVGGVAIAAVAVGIVIGRLI